MQAREDRDPNLWQFIGEADTRLYRVEGRLNTQDEDIAELIRDQCRCGGEGSVLHPISITDQEEEVSGSADGSYRSAETRVTSGSRSASPMPRVVRIRDASRDRDREDAVDRMGFQYVFTQWPRVEQFHYQLNREIERRAARRGP
jgi:hypothetical protein